jgi:hypothetical protein
MVQTLDQAGPVWFAPSKDIVFNGGGLDPNDVVQFLSPIQGIIYMSEQSVATALKLEGARYRNSSSAIPAGILRQTGGEPLSAQELADLAAAFNAARETNQTAALNEFVTYTETLTSPDKMLLIDSAEFQAMEMARLCNIPPCTLQACRSGRTRTSHQPKHAWTCGHLECAPTPTALPAHLAKTTFCLTAHTSNLT